MDDMTADTIEIPSGTVQVRLILGVPAEAAILMLALGMMAWLGFNNPLLLLPLLPIWGFLRWQSYRDPHFLALWAGALTCKPYYSA